MPATAAEKSTLSSIFLNPECFIQVADILTPEDFGDRKHQVIYQTMIDLEAAGTPPDMINTTAAIRGQVPEGYLVELMDVEFSDCFVNHYAKQVKDASTRRQITRVCNNGASAVRSAKNADDVLDAVESEILAIRDDSGRKQNNFAVRSLLKPYGDELERRYNSKSEITGIPTGYADLDRMTAGLQRGDLIIVAARPSMGKTALAVNVAENAARGGHKSLIFSLEMGKEQLVGRLVSSVARVDSQRLRTGQLQEPDFNRISQGMGQISTMPITINDSSGLSALEIRAQARRVKKQVGLDIVIVDYLQLMTGQGESRQQIVSDISRSLKALAKELDVTMIVLSQLNRSLENRTDKRPIMADLRESGAIEQDADVIMFPYREAVYCQKCKDGVCDPAHAGRAELIIAKQRNGPTGVVPLVWLGPFSRFESMGGEGDE